MNIIDSDALSRGALIVDYLSDSEFLDRLPVPEMIGMIARHADRGGSALTLEGNFKPHLRMTALDRLVFTMEAFAGDCSAALWEIQSTGQFRLRNTKLKRLYPHVNWRQYLRNG